MALHQDERLWDDVVPAEQRDVIRAGGHGRRAGIGQRPALLVVDVSYGFTGDRPEPPLASIERFPLSCGVAAWEAIPRIRELLDEARRHAVPVIYTCQAPRVTGAQSGRWAAKNARLAPETADASALAERIHDAIAPADGEIVMMKDKPSAFFGTALVSVLHALGVDSLILAGATTSGCVRATAVDAFSYNYPLAVVEECAFDRIAVSHKVALFEIDSKYGDVVHLPEALEMLRCETPA